MTTLAQFGGFTPDQLDAIASQAFEAMEAGDLEGAAVLLRGLLVLDPNDSMIHAALGSVLHEQGEFSEAERLYTQAIALDDRAVLAFVNRGELRCKRGDLAGVDDLKVAASLSSPVQSRAKALLRRYAR